MKLPGSRVKFNRELYTFYFEILPTIDGMPLSDTLFVTALILLVHLAPRF